MSASSLSIPSPPAASPFYRVSYMVILGLYAIIPLCLLLVGIDHWLLDNHLQATLPSSPNHYLMFQILFGIPHIVASAITLVSNHEYLQVFKPKLLRMTGFIILFFGLGSLIIPYKALYIITAIWTVLHVLKQQHGIARGLYQLPEWLFNSLLGLSVVAGSAIYIGIFLKKSLTPEQAELIKLLAASLCILLLISTIWSQRYISTGFGRLFLWANSFLVFSSFYLYAQHYFLLAILVPRLVHDSTAYLFYITHDYNRHQAHPQNALFQYAKTLHLPIFLVLPLLSFGLAYILQAYGDAWISALSRILFDHEIRKAVTLGLIGYLSLMHYYTESFTWKHDSPYRRYIGFKKP